MKKEKTKTFSKIFLCKEIQVIKYYTNNNNARSVIQKRKNNKTEERVKTGKVLCQIS